MSRAEKRRLMKEQAKQIKTPTYQFTKEQIDAMINAEVEKRIDECKEEITEKTTAAAMKLLFTLPMVVLMDNFWQKSCGKQIPKFTELLLDYYQDWENGLLDMEEMEERVWKYGGIRLKQVEDDD